MSRPLWKRPEILVLLIPAVAKLILQLVVANGYGLDGDELYYLACSTHGYGGRGGTREMS